MKNILFRADSSSTIGTGHIMRDLVLAKKYQKDNIIFATQDLEGNINYKIKESGYKVKILKSNDIKEIISLVKKLNIDLVVIDHYEIDFKYEKKLKDKTDVKVLSLDDTYERHYCDIVLNHNIYGDKNKYKNIVPKECKIKCGSKYTLLRDEFYNIKKQKRYTEKKIIFLAMGGADSSNINISILKVLKKYENIDVNIVTTTANKNLKELRRYSKNKEWISLHINSTKIAKLMSQSDLAIVTPSVTLNEVYFLEIPFVSIMTATNQKYMYDFIKEHNYNVLKKFKKKRFFNILKECL